MVEHGASSHFADPLVVATSGVHHEGAAILNDRVADEASIELADMLSGTSPMERMLLKAAAGAGKSYALKRLVVEAAQHPRGERIAITAFTNKQVRPLAVSLGESLGKDSVALLASKAAYEEIPTEVLDAATVVTSTKDLPSTVKVVIATVARFGAMGEIKRLRDHLGMAANGTTPFGLLFVDEAWQIAHHLFDKVTKLAPLWLGVGDVGQLPPLEIGENPWRGDPGYNPYRAWPTDYDEDPRTWSRELPAVWRPAAGHLALWRAFYPEWTSLDCVAGPGDRAIDLGSMDEGAAEIWRQVGTGVPTLLEVDGLPEPEAADIDLPLMEFVESLLDEFFEAEASLVSAVYDNDVPGRQSGLRETTRLRGDQVDPVVTILATRNQSVDDAIEAVERLQKKHDLTDRDIVASTVDSWQGQTNGITIAVHPLNGATDLDAFNSAFGRLAVACTRATHGLLMVARPGLDELLAAAPARPGTPFGEPGTRQLPRQTHARILATFARSTIDVSDDE
ncbi:AAA family ATPase [Paeniglutamicibacter sp. ABSL32-1]|uniref:AAA family ATPase n=1 Tax=Paeniglutamicibacter quisquiliarum TaxID=2849498 RepID=UPI001C2CCC01|nr:AAA family ATPase [Paeniglutamicibacter quisquiliarum]MBV1777672.1 AAA family ATPase [Paeniglutamicibacter quisquiliarum]